jgi:hypothetical protein
MKKITTLSLLLFFSVFFSQIQKVEPAFWWKGMKNPELQILLYGKNIANSQIELSDNIQIKNIQKVENPNYVFITINTNEINTEKFKINQKIKNKIVASYNYELKNRKQNSADRDSYTSKDVMYLIMPDRFANGDISNDSVPQLTEKANSFTLGKYNPYPEEVDDPEFNYVEFDTLGVVPMPETRRSR